MTATISLELPAERRVGHRRRVPAHPPRPRVRCHRNPENTRSRQKPAWRPLSAPSGTRIPCRVRVSARRRLRTWWDHEFYVNGTDYNRQLLSNLTANEFWAAAPEGTTAYSPSAGIEEVYFAFQTYQRCVTQKILAACNTNSSYGNLSYIENYLRAGGSYKDLAALANIGGTLFKASASKPIDWRGLIPFVGCYRLISGHASAGNGLSCALSALAVAKGASALIDLAGSGTETASLNAPELSMTGTVARHIGEYAKDGTLARPYADSTLTIQSIIDAGTPVADPGGVPGALRWDVPGTMNGSCGTWELVVDPGTKTILHFLFKSS